MPVPPGNRLGKGFGNACVAQVAADGVAVFMAVVDVGGFSIPETKLSLVSSEHSATQSSGSAPLTQRSTLSGLVRGF